MSNYVGIAIKGRRVEGWKNDFARHPYPTLRSKSLFDCSLEITIRPTFFQTVRSKSLFEPACFKIRSRFTSSNFTSLDSTGAVRRHMRISYIYIYICTHRNHSKSSEKLIRESVL